MWRLVLTCEHARARVPAALRPLFPPGEALWRSHRALDFGALQVAAGLARAFGLPLYAGQVSRLVIDLNRSVDHPQLHAAALVQALDAATRARLVATYYRPHRAAVAAAVAAGLAAGAPVCHLAVHSFTPVRAGQRRRADIGVLYDPGRPAERALALALVGQLRLRLPDLAIRRNSPYRGTSDGLPTALRRTFAASTYAGIELELNQRLLRPPGRRLPVLQCAILEALRTVLVDCVPPPLLSGCRPTSRRG